MGDTELLIPHKGKPKASLKTRARAG
uniref:Uncharacterized protein n=1 Tax=Anguilla anguilla TaxID=7936 RepID=A0A0E9S6Z1_ANGAN